jgi:hypothetical protein
MLYSQFGEIFMETTEMVAAINFLLQQLDHHADDLHEVRFKLRERLSQLKATGMPLPEDLVGLERLLAKGI